MVTGLNFVLLYVPDIAAARAFYTEKLGLTVADENPTFIQFAQPGGQGATFALGQRATTQAFDNPELWWYVDDADATYTALVEAGVEIVGPPKDEPFGRAFSIKDPAGNTIYLLRLR